MMNPLCWSFEFGNKKRILNLSNNLLQMSVFLSYILALRFQTSCILCKITKYAKIASFRDLIVNQCFQQKDNLLQNVTIVYNDVNACKNLFV